MNISWIGIVVLVLSTGCVKTSTYRVARFDPANDRKTAPAPALAVYKVQVADAKGKWYIVPGTARLIDRGKPVGFEKDSSGIIYACASGERFPVNAPKAKAFIWYGKMKTETQLSRETQKFAEAAAPVIVIGTVSALVVDAIENGVEVKLEDFIFHQTSPCAEGDRSKGGHTR